MAWASPRAAKAQAGAVASARAAAVKAAEQARAKPVESDDWQLGRGDLTLVKELGRGSVGFVFVAVFHDQKVLASELVGELDAAKRKEILAEADMMKRVCSPAHANIVNFIGACIDDRGVLMLSEQPTAGSLYAYLVANPKMDVKLRLNVCAQVAAGVAHLHGSKPQVLHRSLNSRSIWLSTGEGNSLVAKIGDLGMAKRMPREDNEFEPRRLGTPFADRWAAPEVLSANTYYKASDVWSFGVFVWEVYTGASIPYTKAVPDSEVADGVLNKRLFLTQPELCPTAHWNVVKPCLSYLAHNRPAFNALAKQLLTA